MTDLDASQLAHANGIIAAVKAYNLPKQCAYIATATALTEAGLRMLASANVPDSQNHPHDVWSGSADGLGHDHASCGMFQQQTGYAWAPANHGSAVDPSVATMEQSTMSTPDGWGKPAELMDPVISTRKFLDALIDVGWQNKTGWQAAQDVQHSAYPDGSNYEAQWARAVSIVDQLWLTETTSTGTAHELTQEEDEMKPYLIRDGSNNIWCVRADFSSKTRLSAKTLAGINNDPTAKAKYDHNPGVDQDTLSRIPVAK